MDDAQWHIVGRSDEGRAKALPEWFESITYSMTLIILFFVFFARLVIVSGASMQPTLIDKDRVIIQSSFNNVIKGDIVVIDSYTQYKKPLIKRIIATQGDEINIDANSGELFLNGKKLDEPYISDSTFPLNGVKYPLTVPNGKMFVMGDNRTHSLDSRSVEIGFIDERNILGKVLMRVYPLSSAGIIK